jgi:uncharacterized protein (DUF58 family)
MRYAILIATPLGGVFSILLLFVLCFLLVHTVRLARLGLKYRAEREEADDEEKSEEKKTEKQEKQAPAENPQEPIYYIVERKKRTRASYSEPKQIRFK